MRNKVVQKILGEFDTIIKKLDSETDKDTVNELKKYEGDFNLIKQWREEIGQSKPSVYVIGKTSTGKSEFHNFLLDVKSKSESLFKTSTKVETGVLQTLQHINSKGDAYVSLTIKDIKEFKKLVITQHVGYVGSNKIGEMPLKTNKQVTFLRENIMAKPSSGNAYDPSKALSRINIFYPIEFLKNFIFIDTPGLGSHHSAIDDTVREYIKGKSHIFWFLDTSEKTLSNSLSLLEKEKDLLRDPSVRQRIVFLGNKFDMLEIEGENKEKRNEYRENIKKEIEDTLNDSLNKILNIRDANVFIVFTSFKYPDKELGSFTTRAEMQKLEEQFLSNDVDRNFDNIESLTYVLQEILNKIRNNIVKKKKERIKKEIEELENQSSIENEIDKTNELKSIITGSINKSKEILNKIKIDNIKNRETFNDIVNNFENKLVKIHDDRFDAMIKAHFSAIALSNKSKESIENIKELTINKLNEPSGMFEKLLLQAKAKLKLDKDLKENIKKLKEIVSLKKENISDIENLLKGDVDNYKNTKQQEIDSKIENKNQEAKSVDTDIDTIKSLIKKLNNIYELLKANVKSRISEWKAPQNENCQYTILESFLKLNSLLNEHSILINRKRARVNGTGNSITR